MIRSIERHITFFIVLLKKIMFNHWPLPITPNDSFVSFIMDTVKNEYENNL